MIAADQRTIPYVWFFFFAFFQPLSLFLYSAAAKKIRHRCGHNRLQQRRTATESGVQAFSVRNRFLSCLLEGLTLISPALVRASRVIRGPASS